MQQLFLLSAGSWESNHPIGIFSSDQKAQDFAKKFNIIDNVSIKPYEVNPLSEYVYSDKILYCGQCKKTGVLKLETKEIYEYFQEESVHFAYGLMYYYFSTASKEEALEKLKNMRQEKMSENWNPEKGTSDEV